MPIPTYRPQMTPEQMQQMQLQQLLQAQQSQRPLTYEEWLALRNIQQGLPPQGASSGAQGGGGGKSGGGVIGGLVTTYGGDKLRDNLFGAPNAEAPVPTSTPTPTPNGSFKIPATSANVPQRVGSATMPDGSPGTLMDDGAIVADSGAIKTPEGQVIPAEQSPVMGYVQAAGGAFQAYNGYQQWKSGQKLSGTANVIGGGYNAYAGLSGNLKGAAPYVGAGVAAANIGQQALNDEGKTADRAAASKTEALKAGMLAIPVYGQAAYAALAGADAVTGGKATKAWTGVNKKLDKFNNKIDFGLQKSVDSKLFHQSTRGVAKQHTAELLNQFPDDPTYQAYVRGMREQYNSAPPDPSKPFAGKYASWDEYQKAGLEAGDLTGVHGNINTFGQDWSKLNFDQQKLVTQGLIDANLYNSKKGEVEISNQDTARKIYADIAKGGFKIPTVAGKTPSPVAAAAGPGVAPVMTAPSNPGGQWVGPDGKPVGGIDPGFTIGNRYVPNAPMKIPRSSTRSPGIGLNGKPTSNYVRR